MPSERSSCPCCGFLTLDHPANGSYDICPVCLWEDDLIQTQDPGYAGGANRVSLNEARMNFAQFGAVEERFQPNVRAPRSEEIPPRPGSSRLPG